MKAPKTQVIAMALLEPNNGQVPGLPQNPRDIYEQDFSYLVNSITDDPEMLFLRPLVVYPYEGKYIVVDGNMRYRACKELGHVDVPCKVIDESVKVDEVMNWVILFNTHAGVFDTDAIRADWREDEMARWDKFLGNCFNKDEEQGEDVEKVTMTFTFSSDDFTMVKQCLNRIHKDNGKALLTLFGYGKE